MKPDPAGLRPAGGPVAGPGGASRSPPPPPRPGASAAVRAAGQDDGHARAQHDAGGLGIGQEGEVLGQHVAGLQVRHHQHLGHARHVRAYALDAGRVRADGVVQRQRAVQQAAGDLAAVGHLAQRGRLNGAGNAGRDLFHRRQDGHARLAQAQPVMQVDHVADDVGLGFQVGEDVDRRVGDEQRFRVGGHFHDEHMADAAAAARPVLRATTSCMSSSVCRLPFISRLASPARTSATAVSAAAWLCGASTMRASPRFRRNCAAVSRILRSGPTRIGCSRPRSRASSAADSDGSSQGGRWRRARPTASGRGR